MYLISDSTTQYHTTLIILFSDQIDCEQNIPNYKRSINCHIQYPISKICDKVVYAPFFGFSTLKDAIRLS